MKRPMTHEERRALVEAPLPVVRYVNSTARYGGGRANQLLVDNYHTAGRPAWRHAPHQLVIDDTKRDVGR